MHLLFERHQLFNLGIRLAAVWNERANSLKVYISKMFSRKISSGKQEKIRFRQFQQTLIKFLGSQVHEEIPCSFFSSQITLRFSTNLTTLLEVRNKHFTEKLSIYYSNSFRSSAWNLISSIDHCSLFSPLKKIDQICYFPFSRFQNARLKKRLFTHTSSILSTKISQKKLMDQ